MMFKFDPVTTRVATMRERYRSTQPKLCTQRLRIVTEFYKENAQQTGILKRAMSFRNLCRKLTVRIFDNEVIVGNLASTYRGSTMFPENALHWFLEDYNAGLVPDRKLDPYIIDQEDIDYILSVVDFWDKESLGAHVDANIPEGYLSAIGNGVTIFSDHNNSTTPVGHFVPNYTKAMRRGFKAIRDDALAEMKKLEGRMFCTNVTKYNFYRAVSIVCEGLIIFSRRFADECRKQAEECAAPERKRELLEMADVLGWIMENPCRTYHDALQCMYLYHLALCLDGNMHGLSLGRVDQYLAGYYDADIAAGRITPERAQELMDMYFLKIAELNKFWAEALTHAIAGYTSGCLMTLGGVTKDGKDATTPVTYMMIQSAGRLILHDPPLALRIHKGTPDRLWEIAIETTKLCGGVPTFQNDDVIIPSLVGRGMTREDANDYCIVGCVEPAGTGNSWPACCGTGAEGYWNMANAFIHGINNGVNPFGAENGESPQTGLATGYLYEMETFEEVREAVRKQFEYFINWQVSLTNMFEHVAAQYMPVPLASATIDGCMESGSDVMDGGAKYNSTGFPGVGIGTVADSLAAIKYLLYDKKTVTSRELYDALISNWGGQGRTSSEYPQRGPALRQRRFLRRRAGDLGIRYVLTAHYAGDRAARILHGGALSDHVPRRVRQDHRGDARRAQGRRAFVGRYFAGPGARPKRPGGHPSVLGEAASGQVFRRDAAQHEISPHDAQHAGKHQEAFRTDKNIFRHGRHAAAVQCRFRGHTQTGAGKAGGIQGPRRAYCRLQRVLCRSVQGVSGRYY